MNKNMLNGKQKHQLFIFLINHIDNRKLTYIDQCNILSDLKTYLELECKWNDHEIYEALIFAEDIIDRWILLDEENE